MSASGSLVDEIEVLAQVLAGSRVRGRLLCHKVFRGDWGLAFPARGGARFHVLVQGGCWLRDPGSGHLRELETGELVVFFQPSAHELLGKPGNQAIDVETMSQAEVWGGAYDGLESGGTAAAYLICGEFSMSSTLFPPVFDVLPAMISIKGRAGRPVPWLLPLLEILAVEGKLKRPSRGLIVERSLELLLILVLRHAFEDGSTVGAARWFKALANPAVARVLAAIHQAPQSPWTLTILSGLAGSSRAAFSKQFSALLGLAPMSYVAWWRLQTARVLLKGRQPGLKEVADQVGYGSVYSFSKSFKKAFGVSPGHYRDGKGREEDIFTTRGG